MLREAVNSGDRTFPAGRSRAAGTVGVTSIERGILPKNAAVRSSRRTGSATSSRSKRQEILTSAIEHFGRHGYEYTKWADIAADVGLGSTALYHYFESKLHCLFEIHAEALEAELDRFERLTSGRADFGPALERLLNGLFDLTELDVLRNRVLVAEEGLSPPPASRRARRRLGGLRGRACATSSSPGLRSSPGGWSRAPSRRPTRGC